MHTPRSWGLHGADVGRYRSTARLLSKPGVASIVDADGLQDAEVGQGYRLGRTLTTEDVSAVSTVVLAVGKGKAFSAAHTDVGVGPLGWLDTGVSRSLKGRTVELTALLSNMVAATSVLGGKRKPSLCKERYVSSM